MPGDMQRPRDPRVHEVCSLLARACRAVRFYPPDHPVTTQELTGLFHSLEAALVDRQCLRVEVCESTLAHEGTTVYSNDNLHDNIAFHMYRDGIRSLVVHSGVPFTELAGFVGCLARARELDKAESDLVTVLWEQDFAHIQYEVIDLLLEGEGDDGAETMGDFREGVRTALQEASAGGFGGPLPPDTDPFAGLGLGDEDDAGLLDQEELVCLEVALESEPDMLQQFLVVLVEMLTSHSREAESGGVVNAVTGVLSSYLEWGDFASLATSIDLLRESVAPFPEQARIIDRVLEPLCSVDRLRRPVTALDGALGARRGDLEQALARLGPRVRPTLVTLLIEAEGQTARKTLLNVLTSGDGVPLACVAPYLDDPRWFVVRNMVVLLAALPDPSVVALLERTIQHPDERVRRETVRALTGRDDPRAIWLLSRAIEDPAPSVRIPAARAYAASGSPDAFDRIVRHVTAKDFIARSETEVEALLEALGSVSDDRAVPILDDLWGGRSFLRARPLHVRIAALKALGRIGSSRAQESLKRAARSGEEQVRRQASRCLGGAEQRTVAL